MSCLAVFLDRLWEVAKQLPLWVFGKPGYLTPPKRDEDVQACWTNRAENQCGQGWSLPDQAPEYMPGGKVFVNHSPSWLSTDKSFHRPLCFHPRDETDQG